MKSVPISRRVVEPPDATPGQLSRPPLVTSAIHHGTGIVLTRSFNARDMVPIEVADHSRRWVGGRNAIPGNVRVIAGHEPRRRPLYKTASLDETAHANARFQRFHVWFR